ncbi:MAG: metallophosphoesterase [Ignavibacteriae bacterium]|nr:MAG: metallophosphoesterase [Ignavibacteriota bacterium]
MRTTGFIIFFSIVIVLYALINYYIFRRGLQAIPRDSVIRTLYILFFLFISSAYLIGRILERYFHTSTTEMLVKVGSFWLAGMIYFLLIVLMLDLLRLINHFVPIIPAIIKNKYEIIKKYIAFISIITVFITIFYGYLNALNPRLKTLELHIPKYVDGIKNLRIVMISDIHLGTIIGRERFSKIVDIINSQQPDLILIAGDLVDESLGPIVNDNIGRCVERLNSKYGVYAITGNHEFIGGAEPVVNYFQSHGIKFLRDTMVVVDNKIILVGREDRVKSRFTGVERMPMEKILKDVSNEKPIILLDHQPVNLDEALNNGVDLQLSGHTHHGQIFPFNLITKRIYEVSWGHKRKGSMHIYVSSGVGTWGPPVRIGNHPEIVQINLKFN